MLISRVAPKNQTNLNIKTQISNKKKNGITQNNNQTYLSQFPISYIPIHSVSFGMKFNPNRLVGDVDIETYHTMNEFAKERYRHLCDTFATNKEINSSELFDSETKGLPLGHPDTMKKFVETSKLYLKYKDQPIICLGRSPKWFLNTAFWMKDGIPPYKFVAFSKYWYRQDPQKGLVKIQANAPTEREETAYKAYLDRIGASPKQIVETKRQTGKNTIITDYICTGKGACSFLDILSRYAKEQGVLEEFANSIDIVGIGSLEYMETLNPYAESYSIPRVPMPPLLEPYEKNIKQVFHNIKDYCVFEEILLYRNTNECRSSFYPHDAWTEYSPDLFKTGLYDDKNFVEKMKEKFQDDKYVITFTAPMQDYRNLLNFRILDYLNQEGMLRSAEEIN